MAFWNSKGKGIWGSFQRKSEGPGSNNYYVIIIMIGILWGWGFSRGERGV